VGRSGARCQYLAIGMLHAGQACRRKGHRHLYLLPGHLRFQRAVAHIDSDALAQFDPRKITLVGPVGAFGPGTGIGIVVEHARYAALGDAAKIFDAGDVGSQGTVSTEGWIPVFGHAAGTRKC
jgi:hypothetical protein